MKKGFTLIELMVAVCIFGLFAALLAPLIIDQRYGSDLRLDLITINNNQSVFKMENNRYAETLEELKVTPKTDNFSFHLRDGICIAKNDRYEYILDFESGMVTTYRIVKTLSYETDAKIDPLLFNLNTVIGKFEINTKEKTITQKKLGGRLKLK